VLHWWVVHRPARPLEGAATPSVSATTPHHVPRFPKLWSGSLVSREFPLGPLHGGRRQGTRTKCHHRPAVLYSIQG
jgi:hypothetical protein